jgi:hypothetical protein
VGLASLGRCIVVVVVCCALTLAASAAISFEGIATAERSTMRNMVRAIPSSEDTDRGTSLPVMSSILPSYGEGGYMLKMAYGRTFGTCTQLDYATLELSKPVKQFPTETKLGPAIGEVQVALIGSYVMYHGGTVERIKRLDFQDGVEISGLPKGRFTFPFGPMGSATYFESGAGLGYVSETYRNSGSRWNWSLLGGFGFERTLLGRGLVSLGLQWRHLSNGNMWGKGDELHNSNSGTDMVQGLATFVHRF